jgi:hypothetical protein
MSRVAVVAIASGAFVFVGGAGVVTAMNGGAATDDGGPALLGDALERAANAALAETGGGQVTGTEVDDEDSYYEVEVTLVDGSKVDVQLDKAFAVVAETPDREGAPAD